MTPMVLANCFFSPTKVLGRWNADGDVSQADAEPGIARESGRSHWRWKKQLEVEEAIGGGRSNWRWMNGLEVDEAIGDGRSHWRWTKPLEVEEAIVGG